MVPKPIELCKKHNYKALVCHLKKKKCQPNLSVCVTRAQNTLGVLGLSQNTGKGIFTIQIATQAQTLSSAQNRANLGLLETWKSESEFSWHLSVSSCVVPECSFICMQLFQLKVSIIYIIPELWASSHCIYTSSFPLFPCFISLYCRYQQNKDRTGHTGLGRQLPSDPASQS